MIIKDRRHAPSIEKREFDIHGFRTHIAKKGDLAKPSRFKVTITEPPGWARSEEQKKPAAATNSNLVQDGDRPQLEEITAVGEKIDQWASLTYLCEAAELPGISVNPLESKIGGASWWVGSIPTFEPITLTFICTQDMVEKKLFDAWMHRIFPTFAWKTPRSRTDASLWLPQYARYSSEYKTTMYLEQIPEQGLVDTFNREEEVLDGKKISKLKYEIGSYANNVRYVLCFDDIFPIAMDSLQLNWGDSDGVHKLSVRFRYSRWMPLEIDNTDPYSPTNDPYGDKWESASADFFEPPQQQIQVATVDPSTGTPFGFRGSL